MDSEGLNDSAMAKRLSLAIAESVNICWKPEYLLAVQIFAGSANTAGSANIAWGANITGSGNFTPSEDISFDIFMIFSKEGSSRKTCTNLSTGLRSALSAWRREMHYSSGR